MIHRFVPLVGFLLGLALSFATCTPMSMCSSSNCLGCCDANGRCAPGNTPTGCGKDGVVCVSCGSGQQCISNNCAVILGGGGSSGTGGGTSGTGGGTSGTGGGTSGTGGGTSGTGGGTSGTGGGTSGTGGGQPDAGGCQVVADFDLTASTIKGTYRATMTGTEMVWETKGYVPIAGTSPQTYAVMEVGVYHAVGSVPTIPFSNTIPVGTHYSNCNPCFIFTVGCSSPQGPCLGNYLATSGAYSVTTGTANMSAGTFAGQATNVSFQAWNLQTDMPVSGERCVRMDTIRWNATWP